MNRKDEHDQKLRRAANRAFEVIELARRLHLSAEKAEEIYDRAAGQMVRAVVIAKQEGLVPDGIEWPPVTTTGRRE